MDEELKVLINYLMFTVPHVTILAGALLGVLLILGVQLNVALGIFMIFYSFLLTVIALIIRSHVSGSLLYRLFLFMCIITLFMGICVLFCG